MTNPMRTFAFLVLCFAFACARPDAGRGDPFASGAEEVVDETAIAPESNVEVVDRAEVLAPTGSPIESEAAEVPECPAADELTFWDGQRLVLVQPIRFESNSAEIKRRSLPVLDSIAVRLCERPEIQIEIQVHLEAVRDMRSLRLSRERARAVVAGLTNRGVDRGRLRAQGYEDECPLQNCDGALGRRERRECYDTNRRVEIYVAGSEVSGCRWPNTQQEPFE